MATGLFNLKQVNQAISQGAWSGYIAPKWVEYLVVAGGGAGGSAQGGSGTGGGGGAGGLLTGIVTVAAGTSYTVTVGGGGSAATTNSGSQGGTGSNSVFGVITSLGGGGGGGASSNTVAVGVGGGSGGGAGRSGASVNGGQGTSGQGNAGGSSTFAASYYGCGGGGGAGTVGVSGTSSSGGNGGAGIASSISGAVVTYAGGGGGSTYSSGIRTSGGVGGGGAGSGDTAQVGIAGTANTGGGGGAGSVTAGQNDGGAGAGGSGIVIVRYPGNVQFFTGGTVNYNNGYIIHIFTSSGTLAPTTPTVYNTSYQISRSLRFNSADSANLTRTPATATNQKTWTWSGWVKRSALYANSTDPATLFNAGGNGFLARFSYANPDQLEFYNYSGAAFQLQIVTTAQYRDVSAWYHIVFALDTTQATSSNRFKVYVNGVQVTAFGTATYPSQNADMLVNGTTVHALGVLNGIGGYYNGYMTEINFIDGQALTPSSFGATSTTTGVWAPIQYTGTYGTNGFYLNFSDNSNTTAATLGKDYSGNGNNWTPNNFSVTAGIGNDSLTDTPTNNFATLNPLQISTTYATISNGNLQYLDTTVAGSFQSAYSTVFASSGKYYFEATVTAATGTSYPSVGSTSPPPTNDTYIEKTLTGYQGYGYFADGTKSTNDTYTAFGASYTAGDTVSVAVDVDAGKVWFAKNGTWQASGDPAAGTNPAFNIVTGRPYGFAVGNGSSNTSTQMDANFGQRAFLYTPPSGFNSLCTQNLPTPAIGATSMTLATSYFTPVLFTGTGSSRTITTGMQSDMIWSKSRSQANNHIVFDVVRGASRSIFPNTTDAENYNAGYYVTAFNSDGFNIGGSDGALNNNGQTYVSWVWKANGLGVTNTAGSITSTVSANTTSGFSIVTYTGLGGAGNSVGHGLNAVPQMIIVKQRASATNYNWFVYHQAIGNTQYLLLNSTNPVSSGVSAWNNQTPTASAFYLGSYGEVNGSGNTFVAYCFAPVAGYSAFGSYTGNNSTDGPFVFTGFRVGWVMIKCTGGGTSWIIYDATRNTYNATTNDLIANSTNAEATSYSIDLLSNGFKIRSLTSNLNDSGLTYIYAAFASNPFKTSLAR